MLALTELLAYATPEQAEKIRAVIEHGSERKAAQALGKGRGTISEAIARVRMKAMNAPAKQVPFADPLPPSDEPIDSLIERLCAQTQRMRAVEEAKQWRKFTVPVHGPYALMFFGDPHVDDNGCDWPLLKAHCDLAAGTKAVFAVNIGDTTNNWAGRMARLWAEQDTSSHTARRLAKWLLAESGVPWWLWLHGNHDGWDGPVGREWFDAVRPEFVTMEDWGAKVVLASPNGHELRLWAQHNFKGNSIWNNMHGLERAAQMEDWAHIYVAGHHHDFGIRQGENAHRRFVYNLIRASGYKKSDHYAKIHGFPTYSAGASVLSVIDPSADKPSVVTSFADPFEGVDYLNFKRRKAAA